jgi:hypothetical protein
LSDDLSLECSGTADRAVTLTTDTTVTATFAPLPVVQIVGNNTPP